MIHVEHLANLGRALKDLRQRARITQAKLGRRAGVHPPQVSRWETAAELPNLPSLVRYLAAVDADFCDLQRALAGAEGQPPPVLAASRRAHQRIDQFERLVWSVVGEIERRWRRPGPRAAPSRAVEESNCKATPREAVA